MKLDLLEANQKLQTAGGRASSGEDAQMRRQIEEQLKTVEQKTRHLEQRNKALDDKEKTLAELDTRLRKKKEHLDQIETQLSKVIVNHHTHSSLYCKCNILFWIFERQFLLSFASE